MKLYRYKAINASGEMQSGEVEGDNHEQVINQLHDKGLMPINARESSINHARASFWSNLLLSKDSISNKHLMEITRELSNMIRAGVSLEKTLEILIDISETPDVKQVMERVLKSVREGNLFSEALAEQNFSPLYVSLIHAGEIGGALGLVLENLAHYLGRMQALRANVVSALTYPSIVFSLAIGALFLLLIFVIPQFEQMFIGAEDKIPLATKIVINVSTWLQSNWFISLIAVGGIAVLFSRISKQEKIAYWFDKMWLKIPAVGSIITKVETARFCRTLGILLKNGIPMFTALKSVQDILDNRVMSQSLSKIPDHIQAGDDLSAPLMKQNIFPQLAVQMIRVGEETGRLNQMLIEVADIYDQEVEHSIKRFLTILEPLLILGLGIVVGGVIISVLVGILSINELAF